MLASWNGHHDVVRELLRAGASTTATWGGSSALELASHAARATTAGRTADHHPLSATANGAPTHDGPEEAGGDQTPPEAAYIFGPPRGRGHTAVERRLRLHQQRLNAKRPATTSTSVRVGGDAATGMHGSLTTLFASAATLLCIVFGVRQTIATRSAHLTPKPRSAPTRRVNVELPSTATASNIRRRSLKGAAVPASVEASPESSCAADAIGGGQVASLVMSTVRTSPASPDSVMCALAPSRGSAGAFRLPHAMENEDDTPAQSTCLERTERRNNEVDRWQWRSVHRSRGRREGWQGQRRSTCNGRWRVRVR